MYLLACCQRASTASTVQHSTAQSALHEAATPVRADQSVTTQASRQSWREPACRPAFTQPRGVLKTNQEIEIARPTKIYVYKHSHSSLAGVRCAKDLSFISISTRYYTCSFRPFYEYLSGMYFVHACRVRVVFLEHGALGICKSSVCT